ncbi:MAG: acetyl-CoA carboxylase biotin carboxylase subunit [Deltaproteobacteria bacterium]|nr:acetyl-CoA carboxylase biotin carboxylase subunit [Deltaproteobacteria bacterium]
MFKKILVANRGEIALRVIRACRELGVPSVAVHSTADAHALHTKFADESVCIGPPPARDSYLNIPALISVAEITGADAVHPGYGFLAENAEFAEVCERCGIRFIGPPAAVMRLMGDKVRARAAMAAAGVPILPGTAVLGDDTEAAREADRIGYPVILKAAAGGGGRGMKVVTAAGDLQASFATARAEARAGFGNADVFLERYVQRPRHVELQILADGRGHVAALGERECSVQRRHQKLIEEAPCPALSQAQRDDLQARVGAALRAVGYANVGTVEFLLDEEGRLSFMEMNTRIQVEHTVTEMVTGVDLVREQIRQAAGETLVLPADIRPRGHAIECRINAEDPVTFAPSPGVISALNLPGGFGVRVDTHIYEDYRVPPHYDSLLAKLVVHAENRRAAIARLRRALDEFVIEGIKTNLDLHRRVARHPDFVAGNLDTHLLERLAAPGPGGPPLR